MMSEEINENGTSSLKQSFQDWDAGFPSDQVWSEVEASLSVDAVWNRLDNSLSSQTPSDTSLKASFDEWSPASNSDGWSRMQEELARERVWSRLNKSLTQPIFTAIPLLKMLAATIVLLFTAFPLSDVVQVELVDSVMGTSATIKTNQSENEIINTNEVRDDVKEFIQTAQINGKPLVNPLKVVTVAELPIETKYVSENKTETTERQLAVSTDNNSFLGQHGIYSDLGTIPTIGRMPKVLFSRPTWAVQVGTQLSILPENDRSTFTNTVPNFGLAADISFNKYIGRFKLSQSIGISQYAQSNGKYINGRYLNTNQRLNTFQLTTTAGMEWKKTHFYGGLMLSRLINGLEENQNVVTNVYNANKIQIGLTGGVDVRVKQFENGSAIAVGAQYQWIPSLSSSNVVFENIQGIRFQTKFSF